MVPVTTRVFVGSRSTEFTFKKYENQDSEWNQKTRIKMEQRKRFPYFEKHTTNIPQCHVRAQPGKKMEDKQMNCMFKNKDMS